MGNKSFCLTVFSLGRNLTRIILVNGINYDLWTQDALLVLLCKIRGSPYNMLELCQSSVLNRCNICYVAWQSTPACLYSGVNVTSEDSLKLHVEQKGFEKEQGFPQLHP